MKPARKKPAKKNPKKAAKKPAAKATKTSATKNTARIRNDFVRERVGFYDSGNSGGPKAKG